MSYIHYIYIYTLLCIYYTDIYIYIYIHNVLSSEASSRHFFGPDLIYKWFTNYQCSYHTRLVVSLLKLSCLYYIIKMFDCIVGYYISFETNNGLHGLYTC